MPEEIIRMSKKELKKLNVIHRVIDKRIKQKTAAEMLSLSARHLRRVIKKVLEDGDTALIHKNRGRPSNRKYQSFPTQDLFDFRIYGTELMI